MISDDAFVWCLIANLSDPDEMGKEGPQTGAVRHFTPGTKIYCYPHSIGDNKRIRVLAHHKGGGSRLVELFVNTKELCNWRTKKVFRSDVISKMAGIWSDSESDRILSDNHVTQYHKRHNPSQTT